MRKRSGFTLVELLVAMTILVLLSVLLAGVMDGILRGARIASANADRTERAGIVVTSMARDLQSALVPLVSAISSSPQLLLNPPALAASAGPQSIFFQAPVAKDDAITDVAIVGYFVRWMPGNPPRSILCRLEIPLTDPRTLAGSWVNDALLDTHAPASESASPPFLGLFEENVIALWIRAVASDGTMSYSYDSRSMGQLPASIDFAFVVVDPDSAARLSDLPPFNAVNPGAMEAEVQAFVDALPAETRPGARIFQASVPLNSLRP